jgi:hypothetical protein
MVANPSWHVPYELARRTILPHARKGSNYLATRNMYYANGGIVQRPGPTNALGKIMLDMPNDFDVLHARHAEQGAVPRRRPRAEQWLHTRRGGSPARRPGADQRRQRRHPAD